MTRHDPKLQGRTGHRAKSYLIGFLKAGKPSDHAYNNRPRAASEADEYLRKRNA